MGGRSILAVVLALGLGAGAAHAQTYPSKIIKLVVPLTPGSPIDVLARLYAPPLTAALGQTVIIENRPGAGTTIGAKAVATADPDGHTLLLASTSHLISMAMYKSLTYDPIKDFAMVAPMAKTAWTIVIPSSLQAKSLPEFLAQAKAHPGTLRFGFGLGTAPHIIGAALIKLSGVDIVNVPYKGGAQAVTDMLGGRIHMNVGTPATLMPLISDGKLRSIAVTSAERMPELPGVATLKESGFGNLPSTFWAGIIVPKGTPAGVVETLNAALTKISRSPEMTASLAKLGFVPDIGTVRQFDDFFHGEQNKWAEAVKLSGAQVR